MLGNVIVLPGNPITEYSDGQYSGESLPCNLQGTVSLHGSVVVPLVVTWHRVSALMCASDCGLIMRTLYEFKSTE